MATKALLTGNNFIIPIILFLISVFVITDTLSKDKEKNVSITQQQTAGTTYNKGLTTEGAFSEEATAKEIAFEETLINENIAVQTMAVVESIPPSATEITTNIATENTIASDPDTVNTDNVNDSTATTINQKDNTETIESGVTSSTPALAENVALEIFEINTTATVEKTRKDKNSNESASEQSTSASTENNESVAILTARTIIQTAPQGSAPEKIAPQTISQQNIHETNAAIPFNDDQAESMPAATAALTLIEITEAEASTQKAVQTPAKQMRNNQTEMAKLVPESPTQPSIKSVVPNSPAVGNQPVHDPAIKNSAFNNKAVVQNFTAPNYFSPPQNYANQNYFAAQNQYRQYLYEQQQRQQYLAAMQQRRQQQANQRAYRQAYQQAYQKEMQIRHQRFLAEMKAKQEQPNRLKAQQKIQKIQQKISQLNEEIRQLKLNSQAAQESTSTPQTAPASKQM